MSGTSLEELLAGCTGLRVEAAGTRIGVVEQVLFGADSSQPAALAVRSGRLGRGLRIIDAGEVESVDQDERRLRVRSAGTQVSL